MRINIDEIKEGGLQRSWDLAREAVDDLVKADNAGYRARGPAHVQARLTKVEDRVLFGARGTVPLVAPCGRCLAPTEVDVPVDFEITFVPSEGRDHEEERHGDGAHDSGRVSGSFDDRDANEESYTGKTLDLDPVVREQVLLALPGYPVCQEACKGLCPVCGVNLNERTCGCDRHVPDPRWAALEKFKAEKLKPKP